MIVTEQLSFNTEGNGDIIDITGQVTFKVDGSGVKSGIVNLFVPGSTASLTTVEYEPGLVADLTELWQRLAPQDTTYQHDKRWGDGNGHAHVRASLLGASLVVPFTAGRLALGTWQQIVLVDFDNRPRSRQVVIQIMGE
jgi:secondary thiamine-phosphate synthase enzyme